MDQGEVETGQLNLLVGGFSELLLGDGGDWTSINCAAVDFDVRKGVASSRVALLDTEVLRLVGEGEADLANATLDFYIAPSAKNPTINVAVPVDVTGPLDDPSYTPNEFSLLRRLGGLVGAVIFPPAAILSLGSLGSHDNPCLDAVQTTEVPASAVTNEWEQPPEADRMPTVGTGGSERLLDAVKRLLPLRGNET